MNSVVQLLDPVEFLQPNRRLLIDTNIFMDTDSRRAGGLKRLFERCQAAILANNNPIVVPTKVVDELTRQTKLDPSAEDARRAEAIRKAGSALVFLESASEVGLVRKDLGDATNPYADDLFLRLFEQFAGTYEMCLLTHDITIQLRIRLLAHRLGRRLVVGVLTKEGDLEVDSDQSMLLRGQHKYAKLAARIAEGDDSHKVRSEVAALKPLLDDFGHAFGLKEPNVEPGSRVVGQAAQRQRPAGTGQASAFQATAKIRPKDATLTTSSLPREGDRVTWESASTGGTLVLGSLLGEGGEGSVYEAGGDTVVKVFDEAHLTRHRKEKIELLVSHGLQGRGLCIPSALARNHLGEFVGYVMPKASGREFQRTIFNPRKFVKEYPNWTKIDLIDICISFLDKVQYLHSMNVILGDINPKNLMVDRKKNVFIIDADSWQVEGYPCPVGTPMFTSPRMLGQSYSDDLRTMQDELFAVATMLFMIVMTGQFPYIRTGTDGDIAQLIKEGNFAFQYEDHNNRDQPDGDWKYMWSHIHKPVKDLFWHTFHKEGNRYSNRPTAGEWLVAFKAYKAYLGNKQMSFDPMSNDVYPIRFKAFRRDTPIQDCPDCGRKNAIAGVWRDETEDYFVPKQCNRCKDARPTHREDQRQARARAIDPSRLCERCGKPFISYGNVEWHQREGKAVPTTHKRGPGGAFPAECVPLSATWAAKGSASSSNQNSNEGCFVATAVYGSYDCPQVWALRRWRDDKILLTRGGRAFVRAYYATSPMFIDLLGDNWWFVRSARGLLNILVKVLVRAGFSDDPYRDFQVGRSPLRNSHDEMEIADGKA